MSEARGLFDDGEPGISARPPRTGLATRPSLHRASFQYHRQNLIIGLNRDGQGFALIEGFPGDLETDNDGSFLFGSG
jgi:hypothetical protein